MEDQGVNQASGGLIRRILKWLAIAAWAYSFTMVVAALVLANAATRLDTVQVLNLP
jgi:hypothetical protein